MFKSVLIVSCLFVAAVSSQELKVDVVSTPEVCDQKSKNGDTVSVTVVYVCMYMFQLRFDPLQILEREKKENVDSLCEFDFSQFQSTN